MRTFDNADLYDVDIKLFNDFILANNLKEVEGKWVHSNNYINEEGKVLAYQETSSWGASPKYMIANGLANTECCAFITNLFNCKI